MLLQERDIDHVEPLDDEHRAKSMDLLKAGEVRGKSVAVEDEMRGRTGGKRAKMA